MVFNLEYSREYYWDIQKQNETHHGGVKFSQGMVCRLLLIVDDKRRKLDSIFVATITKTLRWLSLEVCCPALIQK